MKSLIILILTCIPVLLSGAISILEVQSSSQISCTGKIIVRATGSAGPFTILVPNGDQFGNDRYVQLVNGDFSIDNLCAETFSLEVYPSRFPNCKTILKANVKTGTILLNGGGGPKALVVNSTEKIGDDTFQLIAYPNPTSGITSIEVQQKDLLPVNQLAGKWELFIYDTSGKIFRKFKDVVLRSRDDRFLKAQIDLSPLPNGSFILQLKNNEVSVSTKVVLQK